MQVNSDDRQYFLRDQKIHRAAIKLDRICKQTATHSLRPKQPDSFVPIGRATSVESAQQSSRKLGLLTIRQPDFSDEGIQ
jgi:hypothetical protein